ncbi:bile acid:sodium symporter family protein [Hydrogenovibrio marinus]|uniref:Bile acid:sodium symporter n=1 Tax=Hydrogenovibrio marinus TaxID=28885 RepID=A0A066ZNU5_HYDMR|nr:bile acid:sodium symporter family protein [Hydrogenovibrio marinus]KDN95162.1 bile acid:sodium symporter [Hydrogenovibrio marinus]
MLNLTTRLFPLWVLLACFWAYQQPDEFTALRPWITPLLALIMFSMGLTLHWQDFQRVLSEKRVVMLGVAIQFIVMPLAALLLSKAMNFSPELTAGMMLVGTTAGGTASNVIVYLIGGRVALSISMTLVSTLLAVALMPLLTWLYLNQMITVPAGKMLSSLLMIVLLPVVLGMLVMHFLKTKLLSVQPFLPLVSMTSIVLIIAIVVALNHDRMSTVGVAIIFAVILHNLIGLASGYSITRLLGYDVQTSRTVAIEVGMQNSGLSVALALKYFSPVSALPGALFSIWHNLSGSLLAAFWRHK